MYEPEDLISIERYLGSGAIKKESGRWQKNCQKKFKENTFRIIEGEPERLAEIKGISERKARGCFSGGRKDIRQAMIYLPEVWNFNSDACGENLSTLWP